MMTSLDVNGKWHDQYSDHDVSDGQWYDKIVGDGLQTPFTFYTQTDEHVAEHRQQWEQQQQQRPV